MNNDSMENLDSELKRINVILLNAKLNYKLGKINTFYFETIKKQYEPRRQALKTALLGYHYGASRRFK